MSVHQYSTDEKCPNCGVNILENLTNHVYSEGGRDFEYECPSCGHGLDIIVQPVPAFSISKLGATQQHMQSDICPVCGGDGYQDSGVRGKRPCVACDGTGKCS